MFIELKTMVVMLRRKKLQSILIAIIFMLMTVLFFIGIAIVDQSGATSKMFNRANATKSLIILEKNDALNIEDSISWWSEQEEVEGIIIYDSHMANLDYENNGKTISDLSLITAFVADSDYDQLYINESIKAEAPIGNEVLINYNFAKSRNVGIGDTLIYNHKGEEIKLIVKAMIVDPQFSNPFVTPNRFFVRETFFDDLDIDYSNKLIGIKYKTAVNDAMLFESYQKDNQVQAMFLDQNTITNSYEIITVIIASILITVAIFIFAIVIFVIRSLIKNIIMQQYKQIGVKKVIGYTNKQIRHSFIYMYTLLSFVAAVIGVIVALPIKQSINKTLNNDIQVGIESGFDLTLFIPIIMIVGATWFFTYLGTKQASSIKPVQAIKYGMPESKIAHPRFNIIKFQKAPLSLLLAIKQLVVSRRKTIATLLLMTLLIYAAFIIQNTGYSLANEKHFLQNLFSLEIGDVTVNNSTETDINKFIQTLESIDEVDEAVFYRYEIGGSSRSFDNQEDIAIGGILIYGDFPENGLRTVQGRQPVNEYEIGLSYLASESTKKTIGDYLTLKINNKEEQFLITGLFNTANFSGLTYVRIFEEATSDIVPSSGAYWLYSSNESVIIEDIEAKINNLVEEEVSVNLYDSQTKDVLGTLAPFPIMIKSLLTIFLIVCSIIILNFVMMDVNESTRTFGVLKAVGYSNKNIVSIMLIKSMLITGTAVILGFILNLLTANIIMATILRSTPFATLQFTIIMDYAGSILLIVLFIVVTIVATLIPARKIQVISPKILIIE